MPDIVMVGEGMIELSRADAAGGWRLAHGGDTLNTAIHLARLGDRVRYLTAIGDDPFSAGLRADWAAEGINTALTLTEPNASPGLYAIATDDAGERTFTYWRSDSAARRVFGAPGIAAAVEQAASADLLGFSLISLAILPDEGRNALLALAERVRANGGGVAFDGNYRPRLWRDAAEARSWRDRAVATCSIGLPTAEDEALIGDADYAAAIAARWRSLGAGEVVVKLGARGALVDGEIVPPPARLTPRDTSGAGDAFNAGYLHARLSGTAPADAALAGHRLAGWVVMRPGAIPGRDDGAAYDG
ncbi:2-dehydro-3-deoxygluconokinase [Sphingomonas sp. EC-HK361]|uniref:sugar kinase n=1 Tax=Sphingomonas sp. EC-HK361 TaxID=2038397 RepID=UPI0012571B00|nr:sugar kinase [Sphingomonas sp. EC-HK361]VVS96524.1 2-dehydro-3-deoxygluconokinase [Sphingomonas sp. EC-HK361]